MDLAILVEASGLDTLVLQRNETTDPPWPWVINFTREANTSTTAPLLPFNGVIVAIFASFLIAFLVFGVVANFMTMLVIVTSKKLKSVFDLFILSLCVSDLISSLISWINLYRRTWGFNVFELPNFFCWFYWGIDMWTSYVTAQHILSFAILRLISVGKPMMYRKITTIHARIWIVIIWIVAFFCGCYPFAIFSGAKIRDRTDRSSPAARWPACTQNNETLNQFTEYITYAYPIFFYIPLVAIAVVSAIMGLIILARKKPGAKFANPKEARKGNRKREKEKQAIFQLVLIVGSFMVGYLPFTVFEFWTIGNTDNSYDGWRNEWLFGSIQYMCLRFSECLNPVFYNLASTKLRTETIIFLQKLRCKTVARKRPAITSTHSWPEL